MESKEEEPSRDLEPDLTASRNEPNRSPQMAAEMKKISDEFNAQRAKMKELYLQKEADCQKLQKELNQSLANQKAVEEQHLRAQQEIQTLQILVQETCDESSRSFTEYKRLTGENENLRQQLLELKAAAVVQQQHPDIQVSLGPMINHVKKIAKKLGGADSPSTSYINLEGDMRKVKYAQEDAEVLRSLVVPLEEEIKSLKEKLRSVHTELENTRKTDSTQSAAPESALLGMLGASNDPPTAVSTCDMCRDYESRLVNAQKAFDDERLKCQTLEKHVERMREDLAKESSLRHDLETQWQEKREEHKSEVLRLKESLEKTGAEMKTLKRTYDELQTYIEVELQKLSEDREQVHHHLKVLQNDNDMLSGKYLAHSQYLQDQAINLPDDVEELHEMVLSLQENLILAKVGCEHGEDKYKNFADEAALLREQMLSQERGHAYSERELQQRIGALEEKLRLHHDQFQKLAGQRDELKRRDIELKKENSNLRMQLIELTEAKEKTDKLVHELRLKEHTLQQDLSTSETVQQDFVRLSQNLQIQLEKFRSADMTVRWQFEDDVSHCSNCKKEFTVTRRKQHCRHCGTIYCPSCLKTVKSGVKQKPAEVCDVCYFLLVQNTSLNQWVTSAAE